MTHGIYIQNSVFFASAFSLSFVHVCHIVVSLKEKQRQKKIVAIAFTLINDEDSNIFLKSLLNLFIMVSLHCVIFHVFSMLNIWFDAGFVH